MQTMALRFSTLIFAGYVSCVLTLELSVAGFFEIYAPNRNGSCIHNADAISIESVMMVEAIKWTFRNMAANGELSFNIELVPRVTCGLEEEAVRHVISLLAKQMNETDHQCIGMLGPQYNNEAVAVSRIVSTLQPDDRLLQIGFSTVTSLLDDVTSHPNFKRIGPSDTVQFQAIVQFLRRLDWTRIAILHTEDSYSVRFARDLQRVSEENDICIAYLKEVPVNVSTTNVREILTVIQDNEIGGTIFIGSQSVAHELLKTSSTDSMGQYPAFLFTSTLRKQTSLFYHNTSSNDVIEAAKGTYVASPNNIENTEFDKYWAQLFTNNSLLTEEAHTNPWLIDVVEKVFGCRPNDSSCPSREYSEVSSRFHSQPLYVTYAIEAATLIADVANTLCNPECPAPGDFITAMDSTRRNKTFKDDFNIYNFQKSSDDGTFELVKVTEYNSTGLKLFEELVRDYDSNGKEQTWNNIRRSQCPTSRDCSECRIAGFADKIVPNTSNCHSNTDCGNCTSTNGPKDTCNGVSDTTTALGAILAVETLFFIVMFIRICRARLKGNRQAERPTSTSESDLYLTPVDISMISTISSPTSTSDGSYSEVKDVELNISNISPSPPAYCQQKKV